MPNILLPGAGKSDSFLSLLERAKTEELGVVIEGSGSIHTFENQLSRVKAIFPGRYDDIMLCIPSIPETIFLVKKSVELSD